MNEYTIECVKEMMENTGGSCGCDDCIEDELNPRDTAVTPVLYVNWSEGPSGGLDL